MKKLIAPLKRFFNPPPGSSRVVRVLPYAVITFILLVIFISTTVFWELANQTTFCGLACHTMPPQYITHQRSDHARITCDDCHLGIAPLGTQIVRKIQYSWQTGTAMVFGTFHYPIRAKNMRPARDVCETCHFPSVFSNDTLVELKRFADDTANTPTSIFLVLKTGGGSQREGLGKGIHWHIENQVEFIALDPEKQEIPYVRVKTADGKYDEYIDIESNFDKSKINPKDLQVMDCMSCHNRTAHAIESPEDAVNDYMSRNIISPTIPEIKAKAVGVLSKNYSSVAEAQSAIKDLEKYYQTKYADFYAKNQYQVQIAIQALQVYTTNSFFIEQEMLPGTHPDNSSHKESAGCFRCHDGKHLNARNEATRLECNLCHSVPLVVKPSQNVAQIPVSRGVEPNTHKNPNFISLHHKLYDTTCQGCHTTEDAGGVSDKSFCSNSACHGKVWKFIGFDAPKLREALGPVIKQMSTPTSQPKPTQAPTLAPPAGATPQPTAAPATGFAAVAPILNAKCTMCHGENGQKGVNLTSYAKVMAGGADGPIVVAKDPEKSPLVKVPTGGHAGQFTAEELDIVKKWIAAGALEK
ncbi:MAG TPA: NapC/NirT family cytochrome c [Anaerolineaceae bacterium]